MARFRLGKLTLAVSAAALVAVAAAPGMAADQDASIVAQDTPTFSEFKEQSFRDTDGQYIVNGDEPASEQELHGYYDAMTGGKKKAKKGAGAGLVVNQTFGSDDKWSQSQVGNLTYCVSDAFGSDKADIVAAMAGGAGLWENQASAIDFRYDSSQDGNCTTSNNNVLFPVQPVQTSQYIARAFFPSSSDSTSNVLIDDSIFTNGIATPANVLGHELGHVLGFRHEHTRPEAGTCFEDNNWRPLTPYDSASIMHYPQCNGSSSSLTFTASDGQGVRALYGG